MELDKTTKIQFNPEQKCVWGIEGLTQWDQGQKLEISGLDISNEIVEVHFSLEEYNGKAERMLGVVSDGVIHVDVPIFVLEGPEYCCGTSYSAYAWVYVSDEESAETKRKIELEIAARSKPEEYVTPEELSFLQQLESYIGRKVDKSGHAPNMYLGTDEKGYVVTKKSSGGVTDEQVESAVEKYLEENPIESNVTEEEKAQWNGYQAKIDELQNEVVNGGYTETDSKYFEIDYDGLVSLKPQYRGASDKDTDTYKYAISDNGVNNEGSLIAELPERLVIPEVINDIAVTGFKAAIFYKHNRIKEIRIPNYVKSISKMFCYKAPNFEKIENAEDVTFIGSAAFGGTRIQKAIFPKAQTMGSSAFSKTPLLTIADIGEITSISASCFTGCCSLSAVFGGRNVTTVGNNAFQNTFRLKNLSFIGNLTSIGNYAFLGSRVNLDSLPSGCTVGTYSSHKQFGDTEYWSECSYEACENPLLSLFHQRNPLWVKEYVMNLTDRTYSQGCGTIVGAEIYSALEGVVLDSPKDFEAVVGAIDTNLLTKDMASSTNAKTIFEALGYQATLYETLDSTKLQTIYDELKNGALVYKLATTQTAIQQGGHIVLAYGVNDIGELLIADSDTVLNEVGIYENFKYSIPVYMLGTKDCDVIIVKKV